MSAKPSRVPVWATDANYPSDAAPEAGTAQKVTYTHTTVGARPDENPTAQEENDYRNLVGAWAQYLSDGVLTGGLNVSGGMVVNGGLGVNTTAGDFTVTGSGDAIVVPNLELDNGATLATDRVVQLVGPDGDVLHGDYTMTWSPDGSWTFFSGGFGTGASGIHPEDAFGALYSFYLETNGNRVRFPCTGLRPGDRIKHLTIFWTASTTLNPPTPKLYTYDAGAISTQTLTNDGASYYTTYNGLEVQRFTVTTPEVIGKVQLHAPTVTDWQVANHVTINLASVVTQNYIHAISITYDRAATPVVT